MTGLAAFVDRRKGQCGVQECDSSSIALEVAREALEEIRDLDVGSDGCNECGRPASALAHPEVGHDEDFPCGIAARALRSMTAPAPTPAVVPVPAEGAREHLGCPEDCDPCGEIMEALLNAAQTPLCKVCGKRKGLLSSARGGDDPAPCFMCKRPTECRFDGPAPAVIPAAAAASPCRVCGALSCSCAEAARRVCALANPQSYP